VFISVVVVREKETAKNENMVNMHLEVVLIAFLLHHSVDAQKGVSE
jgi:hypothetical protein